MDETFLEHSPANIVRWLLVQLEFGEGPGDDDAEWPIYWGGEPDVPDDVVTTYDAAGVSDGRSMVNGDLYSHYGIQIRIRALDQSEGFLKADSIRRSIAKQVVNAKVLVEGVAYIVQAFSSIGQVLFIGKERTGNKRSLYTVNCLVSIRETSSNTGA